MSKKIIKYFLISISSLYIIIRLLMDGFSVIGDAAFLSDWTLILALILLIVGIFIDSSLVNDNKILDNKKKNIMYNILRFIGFIPFILVILYGIYCALNGFSFLFGPASYGLSGFCEGVLLVSLVVWPAYIVGIVLIIKSNKKIKQIKEKK